MARMRIAAKPALLIAGGLAAAAVAGWALVQLARRARAEAEGLLPAVDVAAYNDALLAP